MSETRRVEREESLVSGQLRVDVEATSGVRLPSWLDVNRIAHAAIEEYRRQQTATRTGTTVDTVFEDPFTR